MDKWTKRIAEMANYVGTWSSCYQENRQVGAVIVKDKRILATGYNGAPSGVQSCKDKGECLRKKLNIPSGTRHETCYAVHAEQNAICQAAKLGLSVEGATIYIPLDDLVDREKEIERLEKELKTLEGEIKRVEGKLGNAGFVAKAPANVVEEEKAKGEKYAEMLKNVEESLAALK